MGQNDPTEHEISKTIKNVIEVVNTGSSFTKEVKGYCSSIDSNYSTISKLVY